MKIASVVGARPNFIKLAPIHKEISKSAEHTIIHTGQHYDYQLSEIFFKEFNLPKPDYNLGVGSGNPSEQIGEMIKKLEEVFLKTRLDLVIVYGDTNSTFAGALSASRLGIKVAHVESGLRSFDRRMPEEINRILTDQLGDYLFAPTRTAIKNLEREHVYGKVVYTGDISVELVKKAVVLAAKSHVLVDNDLERKSYMLCTMHRAENTHSKESLISVIRAFRQLAEMNIVFPIHPRTVRMLEEYNILDELQECTNVKIMSPVGYVDFIRLLKDADKVITDSGGVQKEAYLLSVPCITIRRNTEWIETVKAGWNILTDTVTDRITRASRKWEPHGRAKPIFGDGKTSARIWRFIRNAL